MMRGSQSISDLSNLPPEKDNHSLRGGVSGRGKKSENDAIFTFPQEPLEILDDETSNENFGFQEE